MAFKEEPVRKGETVTDEGRRYYIDSLDRYCQVIYPDPELRRKYFEEILVSVSEMQTESRDIG